MRKKHGKIKSMVNILRWGVILAVLAAAAFIFLRQKPAEAAWFNDNWMYRNSVSVTKTVATQTNVYISVDVNTSGTGQWQTDCGDMRWTDSTGKLLQYYISGICGNNPAAIHVFFPNLPLGSNLIYYYYGNPNATNGFNAADFSTEATNYSVDTIGSQENSPGPTAYWKFDEGQGQTTNDSTQNANTGTLGATSAVDTDDPTWNTEDQCVSGKCLKFDGNDYIDAGNSTTLDTQYQTVSLWVKLTSLAQAYTTLMSTNTALYEFEAMVKSNGKLAFYVYDGTTQYNYDGTGTYTLTTNTWYYLTFVYGNSVLQGYVNGLLDRSVNTAGLPIDRTATAAHMLIGKSFYANRIMNGFLDDIKIYPYARTTAQVQTDYNSRNSMKGSAANLGNLKDNNLGALSNGLVGYWKMDEATAIDATDSSGNGMTGTDTGTTVVAGKFGNARSFSGADQIAVGSISNVQTIAFWLYPTNTTTDIIQLKSSPATNITAAGTLSAAGVASPIYYVNGAIISTITQSTWQHVVITTNTAITADAILLGRVSAALAGYLDDVRIYNRVLSPAEVSQLYNWAPGPVGYWKMDEGVNTTANDTSGSNNNGTLTGGPIWSSGKYGKSVNFNGSSQYILVPHSNTALDITFGLTLETWIYMSASNNNNGVINKGSFSSSQGIYNLFLYNGGGGVVPIFRLNGSTSEGSGQLTGSTILSIGSWYHLVATYDMSKLRIYINGNLDNSNNYSTAISADTNNLIIGGYYSSSYTFNGKMDDVRVYNYARSTKQITEDMNAGHPAPGSPVGSAYSWWKFDEGVGGAGSIINDSSINNHQGTLGSSAPTWVSGKFGKALSFNGTSSYAQATSTSLVPAGAKTVSFWIKTTSSDSSSIIDYTNGPSQKPNIGFWINRGATNKIYFESYNTSFVRLFQLTSNKTINDGVWHYVAGTWDGTTGTANAKLYIDGLLDNTANVSTTGTDTPTAIPAIGSIQDTSAYYYNGQLDQLLVYNFALTADEIKMDYNRSQAIQFGALSDTSQVTGTPIPVNSSQAEYCVPGDATSCAAPIAEWQMDEGGGTTLNDTSGTGNSITLAASTSTPTWTSGKIGKGLYCDGNDYGTINNLTSFPTGASARTLSLWFKFPTSSPAANQALWGYGQNSAGRRFNAWYGTSQLCIEAVNVARCFSWTPNTNWHQFTAVYPSGQTSTSAIILYLDGILQTSSDVGAPRTLNTQIVDDWHLCSLMGTSYYYTGYIDQIRLFNYARTAAQIAWDYNRGAPVAHYKMDECTGGTMHSSNNPYNSALDGTWNGTGGGTQTAVGTCSTASTAWGNGVNGKYNSSLNFDGTDDYISVPDSDNFNFAANDFTMSFFVNFNSLNAAYNTILSQVNGGTYWQVHYLSPPTYSFIELVTNVWPWTNDIEFSWVPSLNTWYLVTLVRSGNNFSAYANGVQLPRMGTVGQTGSMPDVAAPLQIGWDNNADRDLNGKLDDVRIFKYALTTTQIKTLYNQDSAVRFGPVTGIPTP